MTLDHRDYWRQFFEDMQGTDLNETRLLAAPAPPGLALRRILHYDATPGPSTPGTSDADRAALLEWLTRALGADPTERLVALRARLLAGAYPDDQLRHLNLHRACFVRYLIAHGFLTDWPD